MGKTARQHIVDNFTTEKMCGKTIELYEEAIKSNKIHQ